MLSQFTFTDAGSSGSIGAPGMLWDSLAHSPKSMSLQRSQQNGRKGNFSDHSSELLQVGQVSVVGLLIIIAQTKKGRLVAKVK